MQALKKMGMDLIGPLPKSKQGHVYALVMQDYFTKWPDTSSNQQRKKRRKTEPPSRPPQPSSPGERGGGFKSLDDILSQSSVIEFFGGSSALSRKSEDAEDRGRKHKSPNNKNKSKTRSCMSHHPTLLFCWSHMCVCVFLS